MGKRERGVSTGVRRGAHFAEDRRPQGYWAEYNRWWRSHLNEVGERPGREAIEAWHATNAARVWPDPVIRPSLQDTLLHNKSMRTAESSRDYARERRARLREEAQGLRGLDSGDNSDDGVGFEDGADATASVMLTGTTGSLANAALLGPNAFAVGAAANQWQVGRKQQGHKWLVAQQKKFMMKAQHHHQGGPLDAGVMGGGKNDPLMLPGMPDTGAHHVGSGLGGGRGGGAPDAAALGLNIPGLPQLPFLGANLGAPANQMNLGQLGAFTFPPAPGLSMDQGAAAQNPGAASTNNAFLFNSLLGSSSATGLPDAQQLLSSLYTTPPGTVDANAALHQQQQHQPGSGMGLAMPGSLTASLAGLHAQAGMAGYPAGGPLMNGGQAVAGVTEGRGGSEDGGAGDEQRASWGSGDEDEHRRPAKRVSTMSQDNTSAHHRHHQHHDSAAAGGHQGAAAILAAAAAAAAHQSQGADASSAQPAHIQQQQQQQLSNAPPAAAPRGTTAAEFAALQAQYQMQLAAQQQLHQGGRGSDGGAGCSEVGMSTGAGGGGAGVTGHGQPLMGASSAPARCASTTTSGVMAGQLGQLALCGSNHNSNSGTSALTAPPAAPFPGHHNHNLNMAGFPTGLPPMPAPRVSTSGAPPAPAPAAHPAHNTSSNAASLLAGLGLPSVPSTGSQHQHQLPIDPLSCGLPGNSLQHASSTSSHTALAGSHAVAGLQPPAHMTPPTSMCVPNTQTQYGSLGHLAADGSNTGIPTAPSAGLASIPADATAAAAHAAATAAYFMVLQQMGVSAPPSGAAPPMVLPNFGAVVPQPAAAAPLAPAPQQMQQPQQPPGVPSLAPQQQQAQQQMQQQSAYGGAQMPASFAGLAGFLQQQQQQHQQVMQAPGGAASTAASSHAPSPISSVTAGGDGTTAGPATHQPAIITALAASISTPCEQAAAAPANHVMMTPGSNQATNIFGAAGVPGFPAASMASAGAPASTAGLHRDATGVSDAQPPAHQATGGLSSSFGQQMVGQRQGLATPPPSHLTPTQEHHYIPARRIPSEGGANFVSTVPAAAPAPAPDTSASVSAGTAGASTDVAAAAPPQQAQAAAASGAAPAQEGFGLLSLAAAAALTGDLGTPAKAKQPPAPEHLAPPQEVAAPSAPAPQVAPQLTQLTPQAAQAQVAARAQPHLVQQAQQQQQQQVAAAPHMMTDLSTAMHQLLAQQQQQQQQQAIHYHSQQQAQQQHAQQGMYGMGTLGGLMGGPPSSFMQQLMSLPPVQQ